MAGSSISFPCLSITKKAVKPSVNVVQRLRMRQVTFVIFIYSRDVYLRVPPYSIVRIIVCVYVRVFGMVSKFGSLSVILIMIYII